jgi:hypothetical protein
VRVRYLYDARTGGLNTVELIIESVAEHRVGRNRPAGTRPAPRTASRVVQIGK